MTVWMNGREYSVKLDPFTLPLSPANGGEGGGEGEEKKGNSYTIKLGIPWLREGKPEARVENRTGVSSGSKPKNHD